MNPEDPIFLSSTLSLDQEELVSIPDEELLSFLKQIDEQFEVSLQTQKIEKVVKDCELSSGIFSQELYHPTLLEQSSNLEIKLEKLSECSQSKAISNTVKNKETLVAVKRSSRPDIENRKVLRLVKKLFNQLFLYHNDKLKNKRLTNVCSSKTLDALKLLALVYMPETPSKEMGEFLFKFLNIHSSDICHLESEAAQDGLKAFECTHKYNRWNFKLLIKSKYFRHIIVSYMKLRDTPLSCVSSLHQGWTWPHQFHSDVEKLKRVLSGSLYQKASPLVENSLTDIYQNCKQFKVSETSQRI
ncbi:unnamed protein product [Moneuplotes crassus]|uniref:Uncharacterized protein n=1 Tax=Euplotes crassus TaxID=5936 RepID=A0AAD1XQ42_EUPCR|nr:unnamed protein product [Moneuplotes crassus]